jgi:NAD(P)-dependent dehydrogenase (short-subunit alcohol dehydrogenase family)
MNRFEKTQKIAVIGHTGLIGTRVASLLTAHGHHVVGVTHETDPALDLLDAASIESFFGRVPVDHVVVTAGDARFGGFDALDAEAFEVGLRSKLMGQVTVAMTALESLPPGGSVTLTSGALAHTPIPGSAAVALVNGALDSFVRAIALDTPPDRRINVVSPGWIRETMIRMGLDPAGGASAADVARLYLRAIESDAHGEVIEVSSALAA